MTYVSTSRPANRPHGSFASNESVSFLDKSLISHFTYVRSCSVLSGMLINVGVSLSKFLNCIIPGVLK